MDLQSMSVGDVCEFLETKNYPESLVQIFREQEMDGTAIKYGLGTSPGPQWLQEIVPVLGQRLKVHNDLRTLCMRDEELSCSEQLQESPQSTLPVRSQFSDVTPPGSTVSLCSSVKSSMSETAGLSQTPSRKGSVVPNPFPIPKFRLKTEENLSGDILTESDRKYMVQTLSTMLMTHSQRPSLHECGIVAHSLVDKYSFLKDEDEEDGEHSWKYFIYYRCQNVNRKSKSICDSSPSTKRLKLDKQPAHSCPQMVPDDEIAFGRNLEILSAEVIKSKPRTDVLKDMMKRTFPNRWDLYLNRSHPPTLSGYLSEYPLLKKTSYLAQDFGLVCQKAGLKELFDESFPQWAHAVVKYCKEAQNRTTSLQLETETYDADIEDDRVVMMALRCLALLFAPIKTKKLDDDVPYILKIIPRGTPAKDALMPSNNQPYIVVFKDSDDDDDTLSQFFIAVEQQLMLESHNIMTAIFSCIAAHYAFNLSYHKKTGDVWVFIQEKILLLPSKQGSKKNPSSASHCTGIQRYYSTA